MLNHLHTADRRDELWREYHGTPCRYCGGKLEAEIMLFVLQVTCPDCGDTFAVSPSSDEAEQRVRY